MNLEDLERSLQSYLIGGGLFNHELADHIAVRDLLIECRDLIAKLRALEPEAYRHPVAVNCVTTDKTAYAKPRKLYSLEGIK